MRVEETLYSLFADTELERITELEKEVEQQRYFTEKEKNETLKDVILLQDTIKEKDKTISGQ